jgi:hypothetical protein
VDDAPYDPETSTIYLAVGNPSPDLDGGFARRQPVYRRRGRHRRDQREDQVVLTRPCRMTLGPGRGLAPVVAKLGTRRS